MGVIGNNPGSKEAHKQTKFHNHSSREIEGDKMETENEIDSFIEFYRACCPGTTNHMHGVEKSCETALRTLYEVYRRTKGLENDETYKSIVSHIGNMLKNCSGSPDVGVCGSALISSLKITPSLEEDATQTFGNYVSEVLRGQTNIDPNIAEIEPTHGEITPETQLTQKPPSPFADMPYHG